MRCSWATRRPSGRRATAPYPCFPPLPARPARSSTCLLSACAAVGKQYGKTPQQIALKWILAKGATYTCQTTSKKHFQEDIDVFDFELSAKDLAFLDGENLVL